MSELFRGRVDLRLVTEAVGQVDANRDVKVNASTPSHSNSFLLESLSQPHHHHHVSPRAEADYHKVLPLSCSKP